MNKKTGSLIVNDAMARAQKVLEYGVSCACEYIACVSTTDVNSYEELRLHIKKEIDRMVDNLENSDMSFAQFKKSCSRNIKKNFTK